MKILHLTPMYPRTESSRCGHAVYKLVRELNRQFPEQTSDVLLVYPFGVSIYSKILPELAPLVPTSRAFCEANRIRSLPRFDFPLEAVGALGGALWQSLAIKPLARRYAGVDVVHVHMGDKLAKLGAGLAEKLGAKLITTVRRDIYWTGKMAGIRRKPYLDFLQKSEHLTTPSMQIAEEVRTQIGRTPKVIPNGVSPLFLEQANTWSPGSRNEKKALYVGSLDKNKGLPVLLKALQDIREQGTACTLEIVGGRPPLLDNYRKETADLDWVTFLGRVPPETVLERLMDADLYVHPSYSETFGISILEAYTLGLPVLYRRGIGIDGLLSGERVFTFPDDDGLADTLKQALNHVPAADDGGALFSWENAAARYFDLYQS